jgi:S-adenosylmethionine/arginine decarboxylase-like enzyme
MSSHHFVGNGLLSAEFESAASDPESVLAAVAGLVTESGLRVVADQSARFENEGLTLVWILAESHLVVHYWGSEGYASVDLHVCDYQGSNRDKAQRLVASLGAFCFAVGSAVWHEVHLDDPAPAIVSIS